MTDVLPDVLARDLTTVFCGSAAGRASARLGAYYAGSGNRFWQTLHEAGFTDRRLAPHEFREILRYGLGLTDLAKRESGMDSALSPDAWDAGGLLRKIETFRPRFLAFTGKRPAGQFLRERFGANAADYGLQAQTVGDTRICVLPSPSGAARRWWTIAPWLELAELHRGTFGA